MRHQLLTLGLLLAFSKIALAFHLEAAPVLMNDGSFAEQTQLLCNPGEEELCFTVCQDHQACNKTESLCQDCSGISSELLRIIFTRITSFFVPSLETISQDEIAHFLARNDFILLTPKSVYNFYRPWNDPEIQKQFQSLCPLGSIATSLAVQLNAEQRPTQLIFAFCEFSKMETQTYKILLKSKRNPDQDFTKENL